MNSEVSKRRVWLFKFSHLFEIWQAHRQYYCRCAGQISERSQNSKYKSCCFEALWDRRIRRLIGYIAPGADRTQVGPLLAPRILLSGISYHEFVVLCQIHVMPFSWILCTYPWVKGAPWFKICHGAPFTHGLNLIPAWKSNYIHYKVWGIVTYSFPKFNDAIVEDWGWISNFIPQFTWRVITYPGIKVNPC